MNTMWLDKCLNAAEMLYGVFPFAVLERLPFPYHHGLTVHVYGWHWAAR